MKKTIIALIALSGVVSAASTYTFDNSTNSNLWSTAENWEGDTTPALASDTKIYIGSDTTTYQVKCDTTSLSNGGTSIYIANGSSITLSEYDSAAGSTKFHIYGKNGLIFDNQVWGSGGSKNNLYLNLYDNGSVLYKNNLNSSSAITYHFTATLDGNWTDMGNGVVLKERTLISFTAPKDLNISGYALSFSDGAFTAADNAFKTTLNATMTKASTAFDASNISSADVGKYYISYDKTAKSVKVQYVAYNVPEPTTATLSLLALAGLAGRRRRR